MGYLYLRIIYYTNKETYTKQYYEITFIFLSVMINKNEYLVFAECGSF